MTQSSRQRWPQRLLLAGCVLATSMPALSQSSERWYQVEVAVYMHEYADPNAELWQAAAARLPAAPANARALQNWLNWLSLDSWQQESLPEDASSSWPEADAPLSPWLLDTVPETALTGPTPALPPARHHNSNLRFPDEARQAFFALAADARDFNDSIRRLEQSPAYRVLYHAAWRQPMTAATNAQPVLIQAGRLHGEQHELEGSVVFYFNPGEDRVILDSRLWLNDVTAGSDEQQRISLAQRRDMRSNEFHYLDHPMAGIIATVYSYEPPLPLPAANLILPGSLPPTADEDAVQQ